MVAINPKRLMSFFLVAILLKAGVLFGGSLPASLPEGHSSSVAAERSTPRRGTPPLAAQANLGLDLGKLGRRVTEGSVYDMFSGAPKPEGASSGQTSGQPSGQDQTGQKKQRAARRSPNSKTQSHSRSVRSLCRPPRSSRLWLSRRHRRRRLLRYPLRPFRSSMPARAGQSQGRPPIF